VLESVSFMEWCCVQGLYKKTKVALEDVSHPLLGKKRQFYPFQSLKCAQDQPQTKSWRERLLNRNRGERKQGSMGVCYCSKCSLCPAQHQYGQQEYTQCWGRRRWVKGNRT
jgi:hypothetical protein